MKTPEKEAAMNGDGLLRVYLSDRELSCPRCRYSLRGLEGDACPECGAKLALGIVSGNPLRGLTIWVIGISAWTANLALAAMALTMFAAHVVEAGKLPDFQPDDLAMLGTLGLGIGGSGFGMWLWVRGFRRRGILSRTNRWYAAVVAWAVAVAPHVIPAFFL